MCSSLLGLGGTYVQQCFGCIFPYIYVPHFSCVWKYVFTLLHVLSTPRGPPARKSSHLHYPFVFPSTVDVDVVRTFDLFILISLRFILIFRDGIFFYRLVCTILYCLQLMYRTRFLRTFWTPRIFWDYVRSSLCARFTVRPSTSVTYRTR